MIDQPGADLGSGSIKDYFDLFNPNTMIDVGAAYGTPKLYAIFKDAYHVLIEPLEEFEPYLQQSLKSFYGEYIITAVGDQKQKRDLFIEGNKLPQASFYRRKTEFQSSDPCKLRTVTVDTLDTLKVERKWKPPYGLKINAEGSEDLILKGAKNLLQETEFVYTEVSIGVYQNNNEYRLSDLTKFLFENNFLLYDIMETESLPSGKVVTAKLLFINKAVLKLNVDS
ncbi:FkbM family methyltransferase [Natranaerobius thermophilus]|uniref:Methyltransferase FkbM family n=1 Tax=Natranaerobius thermophilus (strain ATCC BAA-1301 / DSM 18059 / JW/NM-WN-LF) TaxID=457570 RepID=B2A7H2_NATTJ|nr:FkbM family methyltransferase [Natranaerobius thermophilus]ACB85681.1 methyltransferase FkbM family [Natranaerobius thermophilus JW/NM-WN-LF]